VKRKLVEITWTDADGESGWSTYNPKTKMVTVKTFGILVNKTDDHISALGNYIVAKQPDVIINAGDHWDIHSLSSYDKGTKKAEGARYEDDIQAGIEGMEALFAPIRKYNRLRRTKYSPKLVFTLGNHEERIMRHVNANPSLEGKLSYKDLKLETIIPMGNKMSKSPQGV